MKINFPKFLLLLTSSCITNACLAQNAEHIKPLPIEKIVAAQQCNISGPSSARWISDKTQLVATFKQMRSHIINSRTSVPEIDFSQYGILLISMGMQRSGGYGLDTSKSPLKISGDTATLILKWRKPAKGMITTQMLTNPCLLLKLQKAQYKKIRVVTLTGKEIATLNIQ